MKLGGHLFGWTTKWSNDALWILDSCNEIGLDFLEMPLFDLGSFDPKAINERRGDLEITTSSMLALDMDISSLDENIRKNGIQHLKRMIDASAAVDSKLLSGVIYTAARKPAEHGASEQEWEYSTKGIKEAAKYAADFGMTIAVEATHRYTNNLLNTAEQAKKFVEMVDEPNVKLHLDIAHMCIEEKSFYDPIITAGDKLGFFHMCGSDRGVPGEDYVNWDEVFSAFKVIGYDGRIGFEGFCTEYNYIWREVVPGDDGNYLARKSLEFATKMMDKYQIRRG